MTNTKYTPYALIECGQCDECHEGILCRENAVDFIVVWYEGDVAHTSDTFDDYDDALAEADEIDGAFVALADEE